jgi:sugar/nucleoside kinase (ribokinase family)
MSKVGCAGILVADVFCGPIPQFPPAGALVTVDKFPVMAGGCAANVAIDLAIQGVGVEVLGCVGRDADGLMLQTLLQDRGVRSDRLIWVDDYPTSKTIILLIEGEDRRYFHLFGANSKFSAEHIDFDWLSTLDVFYLGGLFAMPSLSPEHLIEALKFCRANEITTVVDVVIPRSFAGAKSIEALLPLVDCFIPNDEEAAQISGCSAPHDQLKCLNDMGAHTAIITKGKLGTVALKDGEIWEAGIYELPAVDPTGAGDAFASGIIVGLLRGWEMPETLRYASAIGASAVRAVGTTTSVFREDEALEFMSAHSLDITRASQI